MMFGVKAWKRRIERLEQAVAASQIELGSLRGALEVATAGLGRAEDERQRALEMSIQRITSGLERRVGALEGDLARDGEQLADLREHMSSQDETIRALEADVRRLSKRLDADAGEVAHTAAALLERMESARRVRD